MNRNPQSFLSVSLLNGHTILIDPRSANVGGCWQGRDENGHPCVWDSSVLEMVLDIVTRAGNEPFLVDVGANTGYCALLPALNRQLKCFAFEPNLEICALLQKNIEINGLSENVHVLPVALSEKPGTAVLKIPASGVDSGLACMGAPSRFASWREISVPVDTLDRILERKKIHKVDLIKIDTEGAELFVLRGALETIKKHRPTVICEHWAPNTAQFGYHPDAITAFMENLGYTSKKIGEEDVLFVFDEQNAAI